MKLILGCLFAVFAVFFPFKATAIPTNCSAYGYNNVDGRAVVQSICRSGTGEHRAVLIYKKGLITYVVKASWWSPVGSNSYAIGPVGSTVVSGGFERR